MKSICKSLSIPIDAIEEETITRYSVLKDVACKATLDISQYYLCMKIECDENYDGLDKYAEYFKGAITVFSDNEEYFQPKRLGLRKIRVEERDSINDFQSVFNNFVFDIPNYGLENVSNFKSEYFDFFEKNDSNHLRFNIHRTMNRVKRKYNEGDERTCFQATLDIDAYYRGDELKDINKLLDFANQEEFNVYLSCMKEEYLNSISK